MKAVSWNIDGLNSALENKSTRGKLSYAMLEKLAKMDLDIIAIQETKLSSAITFDEGLSDKINSSYPADYFTLNKKHINSLNKLFPDYHLSYSISLAKKGYSGTLTLHKEKAISHSSPKMSDYLEDTTSSIIANESIEGRVTTTEFKDYIFVNVYTPNSGSRGSEPRHLWDIAFRNYLATLNKVKPVVVCGEFNVAHKEIDLKNPKNNHERAGFTDTERNDFTDLLNAGFVDTFRYINGEIANVYSWWTQLSKTAKLNNSGWRLDYFLVSEDIKDKVTNSYMIDSGERKDHTPIYIEIVF